MGISYDPKDAVSIWPNGNYTATIDRVEEKVSKQGNPMHELTLTVWKGAEQRQVRDYIAYPDMTWKLKRLAQALGVEDAFQAGKFDPEEYVGKNVALTLGIQPAKDGYDEKNTVRTYIRSNGATADSESGVPDDLPF